VLDPQYWNPSKRQVTKGCVWTTLLREKGSRGVGDPTIYERKKQPFPKPYPSAPQLPHPNHKQQNIKFKKLTFNGAETGGSEEQRPTGARCKSGDGREEGFVLWTSLRPPPEDTPNLSTPSSNLAGGPYDVASAPRGRPSGVNTPPDQTLPLTNHTTLNLVHWEWTSRSEAGLSR
jgi:hypothetical protein